MQVERRLLGIAISQALDAIEHIGSNGGNVGPFTINAHTGRRPKDGCPWASARVAVRVATFAHVSADEPAQANTDAQAGLIANSAVRY